jgi:hypothetical protein
LIEQSIVNPTILAIAKAYPKARMWRQNTGVAVGWGVVQQALKTRDWGVLQRARPIRFGVNGQADISGIMPNGRRLEVELKFGKGKQREEQEDFERMIRGAGGIYVVAKSPEEALMEIKKQYTPEAGKDEEDDSELRDMIRWFEFRSGQGAVGLCQEMYEIEVLEGSWEPTGE